MVGSRREGKGPAPAPAHNGDTSVAEMSVPISQRVFEDSLVRLGRVLLADPGGWDGMCACACVRREELGPGFKGNFLFCFWVAQSFGTMEAWELVIGRDVMGSVS